MNSSAAPQTSDSIKRRPQLWLLLGLAVMLFAGQSWATYHYFTTQLPGGNDFYPRWYGSQQLLLAERDPYDTAVTQDIEAVLDPLNQQTNSFNFAFPLNVTLLLLPLLGLSYAWAQALWIVTIIWLAGAAVLLSARLAGWRLNPPTVLALLLLTLTFYPIVRTIFLGQFTVHVLFFVVLAFWLRGQGHGVAAGLSLSLATIKPQLLVLLLPWLLLWFLYRREWSLLAGVAGGGLGQLLLTLIWLPDWPLAFVRGLTEYAERAGGRNLMEILLSWLPPAILPSAVLLASALLGALFLYQIRRPLLAVLRRQPPAAGPEMGLFWHGTFWAIVVTALVPFQTGTTNQVMLILPFLFWGARIGRTKLFWGAAAALSLALWLLFRLTLRGAAESELMFLPLPLLAFVFLCWRQWRPVK